MYRGVYVAGGRLLDSFVKTIGTSLLRERFTGAHGYPTSSKAKELGSDALFHCQSKAGVAGSKHRRAGRRGIRSFMDFQGHCLIELDIEHMGTSRGATRPGKVVYVLLGCSWPTTMRSHTSGGYEAVGPSHIHGLMSAESLIGPLLGNGKSRSGDSPLTPTRCSITTRLLAILPENT